MSLKEQMEADLKKGAVWFDSSAFADYHDINGAKVLCVLDKDISRGKRGTVRIGGGVHEDALYLFIRADEINPRPVKDAPIIINNKKYLMAEVADDEGVFEILCKANTGRGGR